MLGYWKRAKVLPTTIVLIEAREPVQATDVLLKSPKERDRPMTKSLHIARPDVHRMAKELAQLQGTTIKAAVAGAIREKLETVMARKASLPKSDE